MMLMAIPILCLYWYHCQWESDGNPQKVFATGVKGRCPNEDNRSSNIMERFFLTSCCDFGMRIERKSPQLDTGLQNKPDKSMTHLFIHKGYFWVHVDKAARLRYSGAYLPGDHSSQQVLARSLLRRCPECHQIQDSGQGQVLKSHKRGSKIQCHLSWCSSV